MERTKRQVKNSQKQGAHNHDFSRKHDAEMANFSQEQGSAPPRTGDGCRLTASIAVAAETDGLVPPVSASVPRRAARERELDGDFVACRRSRAFLIPTGTDPCAERDRSPSRNTRKTSFSCKFELSPNVVFVHKRHIATPRFRGNPLPFRGRRGTSPDAAEQNPEKASPKTGSQKSPKSEGKHRQNRKERRPSTITDRTALSCVRSAACAPAMHRKSS